MSLAVHIPGLRNEAERGFTLLELVAVITIMLLLSSLALPLARLQVQRTREVEYKDYADRGMVPTKADSFGYPPDLETLVKGVPLKGSATVRYKFLRKIPIDPTTGNADWGMRSMQDDPGSRSWNGSNVFDVFSKSESTALDGTRYADW